MLITKNRCCMFFLLGMVVAALCGCIELEERIRVHEDGSMSVKATMTIDPQFEAMVLPKMREELTKKLPHGTQVDFSQRINGKAAIIIEAAGAAATQMQLEDGSTTITVSDGGFMKKRYEYRETVVMTPEIPFPNRAVVSLPGSIESVIGGTKTTGDTVEFDRTNAKRGDVFVVTSTAYAFNLGSTKKTAAGTAIPGDAAWFLPVSIGLVFAGVAMLLIGWFRSRQVTRSVDVPTIVAAPTLVSGVSTPIEEVALVFCTECGAPNAVGHKFCGKCGRALG